MTGVSSARLTIIMQVLENCKKNFRNETNFDATVYPQGLKFSFCRLSDPLHLEYC